MRCLAAELYRWIARTVIGDCVYGLQGYFANMGWPVLIKSWNRDGGLGWVGCVVAGSVKLGRNWNSWQRGVWG